MKYTIKGIEPGETIQSYDAKSKKVLTVKYLDGTRDIHDKTEEIEQQVEFVMESQAKKLIEDRERKSQLSRQKTGYTVLSFITATSAISTAILAGLSSNPEPNILILGTAGTLIGITVLESIKSHQAKKEIDYIHKLHTYLENKKLIKSRYKTIKEQENHLVPPVEIDDIDINTLDKLSLKQLREAINKCNRYPTINNEPFQKHL